MTYTVSSGTLNSSILYHTIYMLPACLLSFVCHGPVWLGDRVGRLLDLQSTGHGFITQMLPCRLQPWASGLHTCASVTKQYNLVPAQAGKETVGLASHWPCITDTVVYPPTGSTAYGREMSTLPIVHFGPVNFTFTCYGLGVKAKACKAEVKYVTGR